MTAISRTASEAFSRNPWREARNIEHELFRRLSMSGVRADDAAAIRELLDRGANARTPELLGLGLLLVKLERISLAAGSELTLTAETHVFLEAVLRG